MRGKVKMPRGGWEGMKIVLPTRWRGKKKEVLLLHDASFVLSAWVCSVIITLSQGVVVFFFLYFCLFIYFYGQERIRIFFGQAHGREWIAASSIFLFLFFFSLTEIFFEHPFVVLTLNLEKSRLNLKNTSKPEAYWKGARERVI